MNKRTFCSFALLVLLLPLIRVAPALAHGDRVVPQVADGTGGDGIQFITKFDITNLGALPELRIKDGKLKVLFFLQNGSPWTIATNLGSSPSSEFSLDLGANQTIRIETAGTSPTLTSGYAIVRNLSDDDGWAQDFDVAITVYYEVRDSSNSVIDTVGVPIGQPTVSWVFPVEIDSSKRLLTGIAIVNLGDGPNGVTLQLFAATNPTSGNAVDNGVATLNLRSGEQKATYLYPSVFAGPAKIKGMLWGFSEKPVAVIALLQTPTPTGVQYATMVPAYLDALKRNTYMYLREEWPLDVDVPTSDYFPNFEDSLPWDVLYEFQSTTSRRLIPQNGAQMAVIGFMIGSDFDNVTQESVRNLQYSSASIDLSDSSPNLVPDSVGRRLAFGVKTNLGRYAKVRIAGTQADYTFLFQIASGAGLVNSLDQGAIPPSLIDGFANNGKHKIILSNQATVAAQQKGLSWTLTDGKDSYSVNVTADQKYLTVSYLAKNLLLEILVYK
jgi:hypothetical protein